MPYIRHTRDGRAVECSEDHGRAQYVPPMIWSAYQALPVGHVNALGYRVLPYGAMNVEAHGPYAPAGIYTSHLCPVAAEAVYRERDRMLGLGENEQTALRHLVPRFRLRHWRDAYNMTRNVGRRLTGENGRDADGNLRWRSWNNTYRAVAATPVPATNTGLVCRPFGVELEWIDGAGRNTVAHAIEAAGFAASVEGYNHTTRPYWKVTTDASVHSGGEAVSPIMRGDTESVAEVAAVARAMRSVGCNVSAGTSAHVHVAAADVDPVHLVNVLQSAEQALVNLVPASRRGNGWASYRTARDWDSTRQWIRTATPGSQPRLQNYSMPDHVARQRAVNIAAPWLKYGTVEFRHFGHTLNGSKIRLNVRIAQAVVEYAARGHEVRDWSTGTAMLDSLLEVGLIGRRTHGKAVDRMVSVGTLQPVAA